MKWAGIILLGCICSCGTARGDEIATPTSIRGYVEAVTNDGVLVTNAVFAVPTTKAWDLGNGRVAHQQIVDVKPSAEPVFIYGAGQSRVGALFLGVVSPARDYPLAAKGGVARKVKGFRLDELVAQKRSSRAAGGSRP